MKEILLITRTTALDARKHPVPVNWTVVNLDDASYLSPQLQDDIMDSYFEKLAEVKKLRIGGKSLVENFGVEGTSGSIWNFAQPFIFNKTGLNYISRDVLSLHEIITAISLIEEILAREKPDCVVIPVSEDPMLALARDLCRKRGLAVRTCPSSLFCDSHHSRPLLRYNSFVLHFGMSVHAWLGLILGSGRKILRRADLRSYDTIILSGNKYLSEGKDLFFDSVSGEMRKRDMSFATIHYSSVDTLSPLTFLHELFGKRRKLIIDYSSLQSIRKARLIRAEMHKRWCNIVRSAQFGSFLKYKGVDLSPHFAKTFFFIDQLIIPYACEIVTLTENLIIKEHPRVFLLETEVNSYAKGIIMNAGKRATTVAFVFGPIVTYCDQTSNSAPKPDIKVVGGYSQRNILMRYEEYLAGEIALLGEPRYDYLINLSVDRVEVERSLGVSGKKRLLLFATQGISEWTDDILALLGELLRKEHDIHLIIKPHPTEYDILKYETFSRNNPRVTCLTKNENISRYVKTCDLLLTFWSTVAFEAILCNKPIVLVNFNNLYPEFLPFAKEGSALAVYEQTAFVPTIRRVLFDARVRVSLRKGRILTMRRHMTKTDGQVAKRVCNLVEELLKRPIQ